MGRRAAGAAVTGGHGNGGKFYMRQMWRKGARFLTWRDGRVTSLVVERRTDGNSGYWELKNEPMDWPSALQQAISPSDGTGGGRELMAHLEAEEPSLVKELDAGTRGLTAVVGRVAERMLSSNDVVGEQESGIGSASSTRSLTRPRRAVRFGSSQ